MMRKSGRDLPKDFDEGIEEKRRLNEQRKSRIKERRQQARALVRESYNFLGDNPDTVFAYHDASRTGERKPVSHSRHQSSVTEPVTTRNVMFPEPATIDKRTIQEPDQEGFAERYNRAIAAIKAKEKRKKVASKHMVAMERKPVFSDHEGFAERYGSAIVAIKSKEQRKEVASENVVAMEPEPVFSDQEGFAERYDRAIAAIKAKEQRKEAASGNLVAIEREPEFSDHEGFGERYARAIAAIKAKDQRKEAASENVVAMEPEPVFSDQEGFAERYDRAIVAIKAKEQRKEAASGNLVAIEREPEFSDHEGFGARYARAIAAIKAKDQRKEAASENVVAMEPEPVFSDQEGFGERYTCAIAAIEAKEQRKGVASENAVAMEPDPVFSDQGGVKDQYAYTVGTIKAQEQGRKEASDNIVATAPKPFDIHVEDDATSMTCEEICRLHQNTAFATELPDLPEPEEESERRPDNVSPTTFYLSKQRTFVEAHDELTEVCRRPLPVRDRSLYEPSFLTIDHSPRGTSSRIGYLSPLVHSPVMAQSDLPRIMGHYSGLVMTASCYPDLPGIPIGDTTSLDRYGSRMSSRSVSIDLPSTSPTELNKWKAPHAATPYNFEKASPTPSSCSSYSAEIEQSSNPSPQPKNKFKKLYRRVKRSVNNIRHNLRNLLCGTTVQVLQ